MKVAVADSLASPNVVFIDPSPKGSPEPRATVLAMGQIRFNAAAVKQFPVLERYPWCRVGVSADDPETLCVVFDQTAYTYYVRVRTENGNEPKDGGGRIVSATPALRSLPYNPSGTSYEITEGVHQHGPMLMLTRIIENGPER